MRKEENTIRIKKIKKIKKMIKKITAILLLIVLTSCASMQDKIPKRKACTGENNTLTDLVCKR